MVALRSNDGLLPKMVLKVRRAVRRVAPRGRSLPAAALGPDIGAQWRAMLHDVEARERAADERLAAAERALNRLGRP